MSAIRKATKGIQEAQESLKRKKERYDKKKHALEVLVLFHLLLFRKALELTAREKRLEERERTMQASEGYGGSEKPAENAGPSLAEENARLHQEVSDLRLQLELCVRSVDRDATGEKDRLRRRALELTQREQSLLQREEETDRWHEEAAELRRDAEAKAQEAERLLYSKRKELDELESSRQEVASREAALASMQQLKEEAVDQRREQVRLLEEEVSRRSEAADAKLKEVESRESALQEREEALERSVSEREGQLSEHQEEIEAALRQLQETQQLYAKMDGFVKEKRQTLLEREAALRRESQQLELRRRQQEKADAKLAAERAGRMDAETRATQLQEKADALEKRVNELQTLLAEARNENVKLGQEYMRSKDAGETAERRVGLYAKTNEELQQKLESQNVFILQLQKRIAELQESNYYITNDHSRATLALNEVSGQVSRLLAAVNAKSPGKLASVAGSVREPVREPVGEGGRWDVGGSSGRRVTDCAVGAGESDGARESFDSRQSLNARESLNARQSIGTKQSTRNRKPATLRRQSTLLR